MKLRPYQAKSVRDIFRAWKMHRRVLYTLMTAGGKTVVAARVIQQDTVTIQGDTKMQDKIELLNKLTANRGFSLEIGTPYYPLYRLDGKGLYCPIYATGDDLGAVLDEAISQARNNIAVHIEKLEASRAGVSESLKAAFQLAKL